jgi:protein SCO1/2
MDSLKVPSFRLINQDEEIITNKDLIGFNYVVNFFFTSCPTICPTTTLNLIELQNKINKYEINNFKIISISVDPENDTPEKLKNYASSMNLDLSNWELLTGSQQEIYDLVQSGFSLSVGQDSLAPGGVFHSSSITIIDNEGYLRTGIDKKKNIKFVYDGTLYSDIKLLVGEIQRLSITNFKDNYEIRKQ